MAVSTADRRAVRERSGGRCEYCGMIEAWEPWYSYHIEHIIARQHGGSDHLENLALACHHCNFLKGPNLTSIDPDTGKTTTLFHPRTHQWPAHFRVMAGRVQGLSAEGRTTAFLLQMNAAHRVELRGEYLTD
jgi:HNH endonuclease